MELKERANDTISRSQKARPAGDRNTNVIKGKAPQMDAGSQKKAVMATFLQAYPGEKKME